MEPLKLTDAEAYAAAQAICHDVIWADKTQSYPASAAVVARVVAAVNNVRGGDPVGTVRRSAEGDIYERQECNTVRYWEHLSAFPTFGPRKPQRDPNDIQLHPVIYSPEKP